MTVRKILILVVTLNVMGLALLWWMRARQPVAVPQSVEAVSTVRTTVERDVVPYLETAQMEVADRVASDAAATPLEHPRAATFTWSYGGKNYVISETLYGSLYDYYRQSPRIYTYQGDQAPADWEEAYFGMFLRTAAHDNTLTALAEDLRDMGRERGLSDDRIVELVAAFVQAIPYDTPKAQRIVEEKNLADGTLVYPYETLYQNTGVCSDKSVLLYTLLRALGYGAALLVYDEQQHMAVGVTCGATYGVGGSDYCYIETTNTMPIGVIPTLDDSNRAAPSLTTIAAGEASVGGRSLGTVRIFARSEGAVYGGMAATVATITRINTLADAITRQRDDLAVRRTALDAARRAIDADKKDLDARARKMTKLRDAGDADAYNRLVDDFNDDVKSLNRAVAALNADAAAYEKAATAYNADVKTYNSLIAGF